MKPSPPTWITSPVTLSTTTERAVAGCTYRVAALAGLTLFTAGNCRPVCMASVIWSAVQPRCRILSCHCWAVWLPPSRQLGWLGVPLELLTRTPVYAAASMAHSILAGACCRRKSDSTTTDRSRQFAIPSPPVGGYHLPTDPPHSR